MAAAAINPRGNVAPAPGGGEAEAKPPSVAPPAPAETEEDERGEPAVTTEDQSVGIPYDETAESAFRAEAQERGEAIPVSAATEEAELSPLPPLDALVQRIPGEVREALDELFRARFVSVRRIPRSALTLPGR